MSETLTPPAAPPTPTPPQQLPSRSRDGEAQRPVSFVELLRGLFRISRPDVPAKKFYPAFLNGLTTGLQVPTVCIWAAQAEAFQVLVQQQLDKTGLRPETETWAQHQQLLAGVARDKKPVKFKPGEATPLGTNPLNLELFCVPHTTESGVRFVIELFVPPAGDPSQPGRSGRLARMNQLCEYFRDYIQSQEMLRTAEQAKMEIGLCAFVARLNAALSVREMGVVGVNESRTVIGCERVSLAWLSGRTPQIVSVSGHDTIDPRSNVIRALARLAKVATQTGLALQTTFPAADGQKPAADAKPNVDANTKADAAKSNPPSATPSSAAKGKAEGDDVSKSAYRSALDAYPESERPKYLLVIPLGDTRKNQLVHGALIVEQFQAEGLTTPAIQRAAFVAEQVRQSLLRQELLESVPFLSWWQRSARVNWLRRLWKWTLTVAVLGLVGWLAYLPLELRLPADGELLALTRHAVFAPESGVVREVLVDHGSRVAAGDPLLSIENLELAAQMRELTGQLVQLRDRQRSLEASRTGTRMTEREQIELQSSLVEVASSLEHNERQIKLLQERQNRLHIVAPADGVITSWNVKQSLLNRTIQPGDALVQEIDPTGSWKIELRIPEDRVGHVTRQLSLQPVGEPLKVEFVLATDPERRYSGLLRELGSRTELTAEGPVVRATIELDAESLPPLRDGAEVKARIHCGQHHAGFVCFRELIEVIQTYWWY